MLRYSGKKDFFFGTGFGTDVTQILFSNNGPDFAEQHHGLLGGRSHMVFHPLSLQVDAQGPGMAGILVDYEDRSLGPAGHARRPGSSVGRAAD